MGPPTVPAGRRCPQAARRSLLVSPELHCSLRGNIRGGERDVHAGERREIDGNRELATVLGVPEPERDVDAVEVRLVGASPSLPRHSLLAAEEHPESNNRRREGAPLAVREQSATGGSTSEWPTLAQAREAGVVAVGRHPLPAASMASAANHAASLPATFARRFDSPKIESCAGPAAAVTWHLCLLQEERVDEQRETQPRS
jgi:hypothetical protein